jgi:hypothetical protein
MRMRIVKLALVGLVGMAVLFISMGLLIPSSVKISRGVLVQADSAAVMQYINNTHTWQQWVPWVQTDNGAVVQVSAQASGVGAFMRWTTLDGKKGRLEITGYAPGEIQVLHHFEGMNDAKGGFRIRRMEGSNQTELQWFLEYPLRWYPWERFYGIFLDHMFGPVLQQGLEKAEKNITRAPKIDV